MRIATWSLKEGDKVKIYFRNGTRHTTKKIKESPIEINRLSILIITLEDGTSARFDEKEQRWFYTLLR